MTTPIVSVFDLEARARKRLPKVVFDYIHNGSIEQITLGRNRDDLRALALRQHDLRDVSDMNTAVSMVGNPATIPLAIGPTGLAGLVWANGECEAAKAAAEFGIPFSLSTMSICSIEDVAKAAQKPFWFQLYLMKKHEVNESLMRRAHDAGCSALILTIDLHVEGARWADEKNGLSVPPKLTPIQCQGCLDASALANQYGQEQAPHLWQSGG
jgi:L-lactate dehydrogenase (cytochrome)